MKTHLSASKIILNSLSALFLLGTLGSAGTVASQQQPLNIPSGQAQPSVGSAQEEEKVSVQPALQGQEEEKTSSQPAIEEEIKAGQSGSGSGSQAHEAAMQEMRRMTQALRLHAWADFKPGWDIYTAYYPTLSMDPSVSAAITQITQNFPSCKLSQILEHSTNTIKAFSHANIKNSLDIAIEKISSLAANQPFLSTCEEILQYINQEYSASIKEKSGLITKSSNILIDFLKGNCTQKLFDLHRLRELNLHQLALDDPLQEEKPDNPILNHNTSFLLRSIIHTLSHHIHLFELTPSDKITWNIIDTLIRSDDGIEVLDKMRTLQNLQAPQKELTDKALGQLQDLAIVFQDLARLEDALLSNKITHTAYDPDIHQRIKKLKDAKLKINETIKSSSTQLNACTKLGSTLFKYLVSIVTKMKEQADVSPAISAYAADLEELKMPGYAFPAYPHMILNWLNHMGTPSGLPLMAEHSNTILLSSYSNLFNKYYNLGVAEEIATMQDPKKFLYQQASNFCEHIANVTLQITALCDVDSDTKESLLFVASLLGSSEGRKRLEEVRTALPIPRTHNNNQPKPRR